MTCMTQEPDFEAKLTEIEVLFDQFVQEFESGQNSDFSQVYHKVADLLEASKTHAPPLSCLQRLQKLGDRLEKMTQDVQKEMQALKTEISDSQTRSVGLRAYKQQKIIGE